LLVDHALLDKRKDGHAQRVTTTAPAGVKL